MMTRGIAVTGQNYLDLAYPEGAPEPLPDEFEAGLPAPFRWK
jgi:hypothetical protein